MKRVTVCLDSDLYQLLQNRSAETKRSISSLVNEAVRSSFLEDIEDLAVFKERANEPTRSFESFVRELERRGKL
jgi:predicted DNA-binding protein